MAEIPQSSLNADRAAIFKEGESFHIPIHLVLGQHELGPHTRQNMNKLRGVVEGYLAPQREIRFFTKSEEKPVCFFLENAEGNSAFSDGLLVYSRQGYLPWDSLFLAAYGTRFGLPGTANYKEVKKEFIEGQSGYNGVLYTQLTEISNKYPGQLELVAESHSADSLKRIKASDKDYLVGVEYFHNLVLDGKLHMANKAFQNTYKGLAKHIKLRNVDIAEQIRNLSTDAEIKALIVNLGSMHMGVRQELSQRGYQSEVTYLGHSPEDWMQLDTSLANLVYRLTTSPKSVSSLDWYRAMIADVLFNEMRIHHRMSNDLDGHEFHEAMHLAHERVYELDTLDKIQELELRLRKSPTRDKVRRLLETFNIPLSS